jgi:hypothetical protein
MDTNGHFHVHAIEALLVRWGRFGALAFKVTVKRLAGDAEQAGHRRNRAPGSDQLSRMARLLA